MEPICDICGKGLKAHEIKYLTGPEVWRATSNNYFPSKLPSTWNVRGVDIKAHWKNVVKANVEESWGLCQRCHQEVKKYNSH